MKCKNLNTAMKTMLSLLLCLSVQFSIAQMVDSAKEPETDNIIPAQKKTCNFYIYTPDADKKIDLLGTTALARIYIKRIFIKKKLHVIVAKNSSQVANKIISILKEQNGMVGNLWFDSHGLYRQGYSSFHIGSDEFSYKNIRDTASTRALKLLSEYCNAKTNVGIGSCYGGATFTFPGSANTAPGRMNGDSLMIGMGDIFFGATIYGSESWVMMKPGMYDNNYGFAGYPLGKRYRTTYWQPVWNSLGNWNSYSTGNRRFESVNTIALNNEGSINVRTRNYQQLTKGRKAVRKNLSKIQNIEISKNYTSGE